MYWRKNSAWGEAYPFDTKLDFSPNQGALFVSIVMFYIFPCPKLNEKFTKKKFIVNYGTKHIASTQKPSTHN